MSQDRKILGMTAAQLGILAGLAVLVCVIFGVAWGLALRGGLGLLSRPVEPTAAIVPTSTAVIVPTETATPTASPIPYEQLIPYGWTRHQTQLMELWMPPEFKNAAPGAPVAVEKADLELAKAEYAAATELLPGSLEVQYWAAVTLATVGELDEALPVFRTVFAADPNWVELTRRLTAPGIIPDTPEGHALVDRIVAAGTAP